MEQGEVKQYQELSKLYKEIVDSITTLELAQVKSYLANLETRIREKAQSILADYDSLKDLLDKTKEAKGKVPLHYASARGNVDIVRHLIQTVGLDHQVRDKEGNSPFFTAIEHGHTELVRYFVEECKSSPNETKQGEITALHLAANHNNVDILNYLISKGGNLEKESIYGRPLDWAVGSQSFEATKVLLDHGANPNGDQTGLLLAPLILAVDFNLNEIYQLLLEKGANINVKDPNGYSVLHLAAEKGQLATVKDLIERGADTTLEVEGKSPLYLAFEHQKWDVVNFLKAKEPNYEQIQQRIKQQIEKQEKKVEPNRERAEEIKNVGNKFYAEKKYEEALTEYLNGLTFDPENEVIHRNAAACYLALNRYEQSLAHCLEAKKKDPKNVKTLYRQAQSYSGLGNLVEASATMWECCLIEPANNLFRSEFMRLVDDAKKKHQEAK